MNLNACLVGALLILGTATSPALAEGDYGETRTMSSNSAVSSSRKSGAATYSAPEAANQGKTREQVYEELLHAEREGLAPASNDYPPSAVTIARNRERYDATHGGAVAASAN